jgi:hypothetical protein
MSWVVEVEVRPSLVIHSLCRLIRHIHWLSYYSHGHVLSITFAYVPPWNHPTGEEGQGKDPLLVIWGQLTLNLTPWRTSVGTRLRSDIRLCHLSDFIEIARSVPCPVLGTFYRPPLIKLGPPNSTCHVCTLVGFWTWNLAPQKLPFRSEVYVHWIELVLSFKMS